MATLKIRTTYGKHTVEVEGSGIKDALKKLGEVEAILGETKCGACGSTDVVTEFVKFKDKEFIKNRCKKCDAALTFHASNDGGLFAGRRNRDGSDLPNNGWTIFRPQRPSGGGGRPAPAAHGDHDPF